MRHFMSVVRETLFFRSVRIISQLINGKNTKEKVVLINVYCCKQFHSETFCIYWIVRRLWNSFHGVINTAGMWNIKYKLRFATFHQYILKYVLTLHRKNSVKFWNVRRLWNLFHGNEGDTENIEHWIQYTSHFTRNYFVHECPSSLKFISRPSNRCRIVKYDRNFIMN